MGHTVTIRRAQFTPASALRPTTPPEDRGRSGSSCLPRRGAIDLAAGGAEIDAAIIERVDGHRVAQDIHVAVLLRQTFGERFPLVAAGAAAIDAQLAIGT